MAGRLAYLFMTLMTGAIVSLVSVQTAGAAEPSDQWSADQHLSSGKDSSGRQLAIAMPTLPSSAAAKVPFIRPGTSASRAQSTIVRITVPEQVGQAADAVNQASQKMVALGGPQAREALNWVAVWIKQNAQLPTLTPAGGPYNEGLSRASQ
jgi:hypothetical protein